MMALHLSQEKLNMKTIIAFVAVLALTTADTCTDCTVIGILRFSSQEDIVGDLDIYDAFQSVLNPLHA